MESHDQRPAPTSSASCHIIDWMAWAPGLEAKESWQVWAQAQQGATKEGVPDVGFVPAQLRRRMSPLSKMSLYVAHHCLLEREPARVVFGSSHGELHRTLQILEAIAHKAPVSPTQFSLSVHNTSTGLFSIAHQCQAPGTAIAAGTDTFLFAMLEAIGWLQNHPDELILVVIADQPLPAAYQRFVDEEEMAYAVALLLTSPVDSKSQLVGTTTPSNHRPIFPPLPQVDARASTKPAVGASIKPDAYPLPGALQFLRWWLNAATTSPLVLTTQQQSRWSWSCHEQMD